MNKDRDKGEVSCHVVKCRLSLSAFPTRHGTAQMVWSAFIFLTFPFSKNKERGKKSHFNLGLATDGFLIAPDWLTPSYNKVGENI